MQLIDASSKPEDYAFLIANAKAEGKYQRAITRAIFASVRLRKYGCALIIFIHVLMIFRDQLLLTGGENSAIRFRLARERINMLLSV